MERRRGVGAVGPFLLLSPPITLGAVRVPILFGLGLAIVGGLALLAAGRRRTRRRLASLASAMDRIGRGDLEAEVPRYEGREPAHLSRSLERMRQDVRARVETAEGDRTDRDAILSALQDAVVVFDAAGAVRYRNARAEELLGGLGGVGGLASTELRRVASAAGSGDRPAPVDVVAGPGSRKLRATAAPIAGGNILLVLRDLTQAEAIDAVRRDFVANASHELKTPAASIQALAETLVSAAKDDPAAVRRFAEQLDHEAMRLSRVVSDLLDLSRLEGEEATPARVRLDAVVREEAGRIQSLAEQAGIHMQIEADSPVAVRGSFRDLGLLVRNLAENAVQYTRPGGTVVVEVRAAPPHAVLTVRDNGIGIPSRHLGRVFERFYRVDRARSRETGGTGLGLSIVKHVVENHQGTVDVDSELGVGSTFNVRIPLSD